MTWKAVLLLVALLVVAESGWVRWSVKFSELKEHNGWAFLGKVPFKEGVAKFDVEVFVRGKGKSRSHDVYIQGIAEEKWEEEQEKKCKNPVRMPVMINQARMTGQKDRDMFQFSVAQETNYYFTLKDCFQMFRKDYENDNLTLHVNVRPYNNEVEFDLPEGEDEEESVEEPSVEYEEEPEEVQAPETAVTEPNSENEAKAETAESATTEAAETAEIVAVEESVEAAETEIQLVESTPEESNPAPTAE